MEYGLFIASAAVSALSNLAGRFRAPRPMRILVVKLDHLGDVVQATPVFRALQMAFPDTPIDALVGSGGRALLDANPFVSRVLVYDAPRFRRPGQPRPSRRGAWRRLRDVASARYTHIVELRGDAWTLALPFLCGSVLRADRGTVRIAKWLARRRGGDAATEGAPAAHEVETNLAVLRPLLDGREPEDRPEVFVTEYERRGARERLAELGLDSARAFAAIHPGASWRPRAWRPERYAELAARLSKRHGLDVVFLGDSSERDIEAALAARLGPAGAGPGARHAFCFGTLTLREAVAILAEARLVIGNDSGFVHVAAALGAPVVALFGAQLPERFRPWSPRAVTLHHRVDCCPCTQRVCIRPDDPCVNLVTVDEAEAAAARLLRETRP